MRKKDGRKDSKQDRKIELKFNVPNHLVVVQKKQQEEKDRGLGMIRNGP